MILQYKKEKRRKIKLKLIGIILLLIFLRFLYYYWIPVKFSVKEDNFEEFENFILIREVHYTGTGWTQLGNENGYYKNEDIKDIHIVGNLPPLSKMMQHVNIFLCEVEYQGEMEFKPSKEIVDTYFVKEWYPVYPVVRDSLIPSVFLPKYFLSKIDIPTY